ncbi:MAG: hypothetical protein H6945_13285 [Zoogloeaceae bacterium]|nr:hypothetical protein [Rhodocyclaceae bacterium]MCP5236700.1 hypothetical protein [Zoogloeaceae bacterium]
MARAFVIRPFGEKRDREDRRIDFERIHDELFAPALAANGLDGSTTGEIIDAGNIREDMFALIVEADLVICDVTLHNANVFYELGIRHGLRRKGTILVKGRPSAETPPFDLLTDRYLAYPLDTPATALADLRETIRATLVSTRDADSPVFRMLPSLREADPADIVVVPLDFAEEVARARKAGALGWLRLLADELRGLRFEREGLRLIARAQWQLKDYAGAETSWLAVRDRAVHDIDANLALANVCERLYRSSGDIGRLSRSDQAIERLLASDRLDRRQRAEVMALKSRNGKTRWRLAFAGIADAAERRRAAISRQLFTCYEEYRTAYRADLNHFYSGVNACQLGRILLGLAADEAWFDIFDSDAEADAARERLRRELTELLVLVAGSVDAALANLADDDDERVWAMISRADLQFLEPGQRDGRVLASYRDAIPLDQPFAWDAARGQLELFESLGLRGKLARRVIDTLDARFAALPRAEPQRQTRLIVFAGHRIDGPDRQSSRFPAAAETAARERIRTAIAARQGPDFDCVLLASAAPGADILAHETCRELGIRSVVCLPMPPADFARTAFADCEPWRARFLDLMRDADVMQLSDRAGLPHWLAGRDVDPWERGNRWVVKLAQSWGADEVVLVALWDGLDIGDGPGGTAQMVALARAAGDWRIEVIDAGDLAAG